MSDTADESNAANANVDFESFLDSRKRWWDVTDNPLFAWEVVEACLESSPRRDLPDWCMTYLTSAAHNIGQLYRGRDWRDAPPSRVSPEKAIHLVPVALGLVRQGQKNAFIRVSEDAEMMRHAVTERFYRSPITEIVETHNIEPDQARRKLTHGRKLLGKG